MLFVVLLAMAVGLAGYFGFKTFSENLLYFFSPSDVVAGKNPIGTNFRLGGLVMRNSVEREGIKVNFIVTDNVHTFKVSYEGILPDLFTEGQGVIAIGSLVGNVFVASEILAKHDENYMSPEVADMLKKTKL